MPKYDYRCEDCQYVFTEFKRISQMNEPCGEPCPDCEKTGHVKKVILGAPLLVDPLTVGRLKHTNEDTRQRLQQINKNFSKENAKHVSTYDDGSGEL